MFRYVHTNIIARDHQKLVDFYKEVFHCRSIGEKRDLRGAWLDELTEIHDAHIVGEYLCLPGYDDGRKATFVYARDCEGNIVELQSWS